MSTPNLTLYDNKIQKSINNRDLTSFSTFLPLITSYLLNLKLPIKSFNICACPDNSSLAAALSSAVAALV